MSIWTNEMIVRLLALVKEGMSASQIGERLRVSRNAVIGKVHRLGEHMQTERDGKPDLPRRLRRAREQMRKYEAAQLEPLPPRPRPLPLSSAATEEPPPPAEPTTGAPITLFDLESNSCRWPTNDGRPEFYFCGKARVDGLPYCAQHVRKAYNKSSKPTEVRPWPR